MTENNLEDKIMEINGMMQSIVSTLEIMCDASENADDNDFKKFICSLVLVSKNAQEMLEKQKKFTNDFQTKYCL